MNRPRLFFLASLLVLTGGCKADAVRGNLADMSIIDRDTGAVLTPYRYHGDYWVAGRPGSRYAVEVRNHLGERLLVVMSVDGINVVSGATAAWDQAGYVFSARDEYQVTGRPANVGVIGVALFRERAPLPIPAQSRAKTAAAESRDGSNFLGLPFANPFPESAPSYVPDPPG